MAVQRAIPLLAVELAKSSAITPLFAASLDHGAAIARVPDNLSAAEQRALLKGLEEGLPFFARLRRSQYDRSAAMAPVLARQARWREARAG